MKKILGLLFLLFCCKSVFAEQPFQQIIFFGDSLTDNGNLYHVLKVFPPAPYYQGRFTNGFTWAEDMGKYYYDKYNIPTVNYAYGGATAILHKLKTDKFIAPITLEGEVYSYNLHSLLKDKSKILYVIWIGANDYLWETTDDINGLTDKVVNKIAWSITTLMNQGANKFLILNLPDLAKTPYAGEVQAMDRLHMISEMHNKKLNDKILELKNQYPTSKFVTVDVFSILNDLLSDPEKYNQQYKKTFKNLSEPCVVKTSLEKTNLNVELKVPMLMDDKKMLDNYSSDAVSNYIANSPALAEVYQVGQSYAANATSVCPNPSEYIFWDPVHPTADVHEVLSQIVVKQLIDAGVG